MNDGWYWLLGSGAFMPHGHCYLWEPLTLWLNVRSDALIAGAIKLLTGIVSFATLLGLIWITPRALSLRSPLQLQAEVSARTAEIEAVNARLTAEIAARDTAERQLSEADQRKDEFLATLAQELRNPLGPARPSGDRPSGVAQGLVAG